MENRDRDLCLLSIKSSKTKLSFKLQCIISIFRMYGGKNHLWNRNLCFISNKATLKFKQFVHACFNLVKKWKPCSRGQRILYAKGVFEVQSRETANDFCETLKYFQEETGFPRDLNTVALVEFNVGKYLAIRQAC